MAEGFKSALPLPLGIGRPAATVVLGFRTLPWFWGGIDDSVIEPPVPPPPPPPSTGGRWVDQFERFRRKRVEDDDEEVQKAPPVEVVTGVVSIPALASEWKPPVGRKVSYRSEPNPALQKIENERLQGLIRRRKALMAIIRADDDWMMLN